MKTTPPIALLCLACGFAGVTPAPAQDDGPEWERLPYAVRVSVAADPADLPPREAAGVRADLGDLLWRTFGEHWTVRFAPPPDGLTRFDAVGLARLTADDFPAPPPPPTPPAGEEEGGEPSPPPAAEAAPPDRWFVATLSRGPAGWEVAAREWDGTRRVLGPLRAAGASGEAAAAHAAGGLIRDLFHPEYRVSVSPDAVVGSNDVLVTARAAALPVRDPGVDPLAAGRWLSVFLRLNDRDGALKEVRETPFTFLRTGGVADPEDPARTLTGEVVSALRSAVGRTRGRTTTLARPIRQDLPATAVRLVARGTVEAGVLASGRPLVGYRVLIADRRTLPDDLPPPKDGEEPPEPEPIPEPIEEVSDRRGRITVPAVPPTLPDAEPAGPGLVWLHVYSGKAKLGALPYVAGAVPADLLELDDDALRLGLEGEYALLAGEMTEVVANRAVLTARAKKAAKAEDWDAAEARLVELGRLPRAEAFQRQIDALAAGTRAKALAVGDRLTAARATKLAAKMRDLAAAYLSSDPLAAAKEQVGELRKLSEEVAERQRRAEGRARRGGGS